ncbi:pathogenicity island mobilization protein BfmB, partial [Bacteroides fragilis]
MYCKPHRPGNTPQVPDNKGKCTRLVDYLSKESQVERPYYDNFFSQQKDYVIPLTVKNHIDNNHRTLKSKDDKFYMLSINPSGDEQRHLIERVTGRKVGEFSELTPGEQESVLAQMKKFTRECMDEYALNFYREKIKSGDDLVWYGRVETERHYKNDDPEVKAGRAKAGDK